jgi:SpoVK/Ycf46/Vps4 family AAA+-type ATPase
MAVRFSQRSGKSPEIRPLILLHGPPGTGKTTLCQALAQKISIRLNSSYKRTKFIQIKTATLLSKFYSQSAKQVDEIFNAIGGTCEEDPEQFICILIDEVESIASSRESSMHGEVQDSLRATNALLTGLDRTQRYSNVIFLCTSNIPGCLDWAFLDRCGLKFEVNPPVPTVQYEILRGRIQHLINDGHIISERPIPSYRDAELEFDTDEQLPGSRLLGIVELLNSVDSASSQGALSGRTLTQLPGKAVLRYLEDDECDLEMAFKFMEKSILADNGQGTEKSRSEVCESPRLERESAGFSGQKGKITEAAKDDWEVDRVLAALEVIETLVDAICPGRRKLKRERG